MAREREGEPRVACKSFKYLYLPHIWRLWLCVSCNFFARHTHVVVVVVVVVAAVVACLRDVRKKKQQPNGKTANRIIVAASVAVAPSSSMSKLLFFLPHNPPLLEKHHPPFFRLFMWVPLECFASGFAFTWLDSIAFLCLFFFFFGWFLSNFVSIHWCNDLEACGFSF